MTCEEFKIKKESKYNLLFIIIDVVVIVIKQYIMFKKINYLHYKIFVMIKNVKIKHNLHVKKC